MSYNWQSAATPQGRERLKKLLDQGLRIVGKVGQFGRITAFWKHDNGYDVDAFLPDEWWYNARAMDGLEFLDPEPALDTDLDAIIQAAWAKFSSGLSDDFEDFRDAVKEAIERALQMPPAPDENDDEEHESEEDREWIASYNQQVAWKYEIYDPETTEYRDKDKNGAAKCWNCNASVAGKFSMCCNSYSQECGCYGMPIEPPFCSKECHIGFIEKWKGNDGSERALPKGGANE